MSNSWDLITFNYFMSNSWDLITFNYFVSNSWDSITPYCQVPSLIIIKRFCLDSPNVTLVYGLGIDNTNTRSVQIEGIVYLKKQF